MHSPRFFRLLIVLFALGLAGVGQAQGDEQSPSLSPIITWSRNTIDSAGDVGQYASLALNPTTGLPHISYFDATAGNLRHAYLTNNPINIPCQANGWECETWNTPSSDGSNTAMAFRSNGNYGILYLNTSEVNLYIRGDQGDGIPFANTSINSFENWTGYAHDLRYDRYGIPHATFVSGYLFSDNFYHAKYVGSGGNCNNNAWHCEPIIVGVSGGILSTSLDMTYSGSPRVTFGRTNGLMYASQVTNNGNCYTHWDCDFIESGIVVTAVSLFQPQCQNGCTDPVRIAYYDFSNGRLKLATSVSSGGNCGVAGQAGKWQCDIIETIGLNGQYGVSINVHNGQPYIAYTDGDDRANTTLKFAYPSPGGNCGPTLNNVGSWQCETVDSGLRYVGGFPLYRNVGLYPSAAINSNHTIYISYYDGTADDLLVAVGEFDEPPPPPSSSYKIYLPAVLR